jgi:hypothetical protein
MPYSTSLPFDQISLPQQVPIIDPQFEDEAFELAFAEAENALQPVSVVESEVVEEERQLTEKEEGDMLAQTAGELFESLKYKRDTDEKFRNSTFMALMKKLRDREVVVAGNDMVESSSLNEEAMEVFN